MLSKTAIILFKSIKAYGISSILCEPLINMANSMDVDLIALCSALTIETLFVLLKYGNIQVPEWIEAAEDLL